MTTSRRQPVRFVRNALANWISFLLAALVGFFLSPYFIGKLGPTEYGVWILTAGLIGYLSLFDLGIRQAVNRYTAHHLAVGAHEEASSIISAALRLFGFLGILAIVVAALLAYVAPLVFNIPDLFVDEARTIIVIGGVTIAVTLVGGVFGGIISGLERFDVNCLVDVFVTAVRTVAFVAALHEGYGLVTLAVIQLVTSLLNSAVCWAASQALYRELRIRWSGALGQQIRTILSFGAPLTALYVLHRITSYSDILVIGALLPIEAVTSFAIAGTLCVYAKDLPLTVSNLITPRVSAMTSVGSNRVGELVLGVTRISTLASAPVALTFILRGETFIALWMGPEYAQLSAQVLRILALVVWLDASRSVAINSLTGMGKQSTLLPGLAVQAGAHLVLSVALARPFGIVGIALGTVISNLAITLVYIPRRLSKVTGISLGQFYRNALLLPTIATLPFGLMTALTELFVPTANMAVFFLQTLLLLPLVPMVAWAVCLSKPEKEQVRSMLGRIAF